VTAAAYCQSCRHFWPTDGNDERGYVGRCHRYPPIYIPAVSLPMQPDEWRYPRVTSGDGCGEHAVKVPE
jgi:hypothetical protein